MIRQEEIKRLSVETRFEFADREPFDDFKIARRENANRAAEPNENGVWQRLN